MKCVFVIHDLPQDGHDHSDPGADEDEGCNESRPINLKQQDNIWDAGWLLMGLAMEERGGGFNYKSTSQYY